MSLVKLFVTFTTKTRCSNARLCTQKLEKELKLLLPTYEPGINGHTSCHHEKNKHTWFIALYSKQHESQERPGVLLFQKLTQKQKKFQGTLPTEKQLKELISF